jgi:large subunit ribosomal protein L3
MKFILGLKLGMSQIFDEKGKVVPVSLIEAGPCIVTQVKTKEKDGYSAVQIGFGEAKKVTKAMAGHLKNLGKLLFLREFQNGEAKINDKELKKGDKVEASSSLKPHSPLRAGSVIDVSVFKEGDKIRVSGLSKGKGFAGVVKRWHFKGRPSSHGTKHELRTPGSVGATTPERVIKGKKMPGRMGFKRITVKNLELVKVDKEKNLLAVRGAVPGRKGTLLEIRG